MNRRIPAFIAITLTVLATLVFAAPASATTRVSHGTPFSGIAAGSDPVMAISANGERVVSVSTPRAGNGCPDGSAAFLLKGGFANSDGTTWEDHNEWLEAWPSEPCSVATAPQVVLSDDGTTGLIVWIGFDFGAQMNMLRFARIDWATGSFPTVTQNDLRFDAGSWGWPNLEPKVSVALSLDGSRAVVAWARNTVDPSRNSTGSTVAYSVIDMNNPSASTAQSMPGGIYPGLTNAPDVAISADGSVVMMSRPGSPNQNSTSEFRIARIFTCSHNCYPSRLKAFQASVPAGSGGSSLEVRMNLAGDRIAVGWAKQGAGHKASIAVFNPSASVPSSTVTDITAKLVTVSSVDVGGGDLVLAMNESGTRLAYVSQLIDKTTIVSAAITPSLAVSSVSTADMYPALTRNIQQLVFLNATTGSQGVLPTPERLAVVTPDSTGRPNAQDPTIAKVLVSDSSSKPTNWSDIYSTSAPVGAWFSSFGFTPARSSTRFVTFASTVTLTTFFYSYESNAVVNAAQNVLTLSTKPGLSGTGAYNTALTLNTGKWTSGATVSYVWKRDGASLDPQPAGLKYTPLSDDDMGARMSSTITATKSGYYDTVITPAESPVMNGKPIRPVLQISGMTGANDAPAVGNTLFPVRTGTFPETGVTVVSLSWKIGNRGVGTAGTYVVQAGDVGKKISLTIKVSCPNWASATISQTTTVVIPAGR